MICCPIKILERQKNLKHLVINYAKFNSQYEYSKSLQEIAKMEVLKIYHCGNLYENGKIDVRI